MEFCLEPSYGRESLSSAFHFISSWDLVSHLTDVCSDG
jgi:hypothetical protein